MRRSIAAGALAVTTVATSLVPVSATADSPAAAVTAVPVVVATTREQHSHSGHDGHPASRTLSARTKAAQAALLRRKHAAAVHAAAVAAAKRKAAAAAKARAHAAAVAKARASRAAARRALYTPSYVWAHKPFSIRVANCESGNGPTDHSSVYRGNAHLHDPNGHYGKWQFDYSTWREVGGSGNPADYSEATQDRLAYKLWLANGWSRWECAHMVG